MDPLDKIEQRLDRIENLLESLQTPEREKYFYSTNEVAERLDLSKWYVRRLCSTGEILAEKHPESGRFLISADELERIESRRDALDD
ncbi:helix-turn-helix domain-containing protein [Stieleria sp. ICT_E10.1]|uniref:helix-turn-helix domain-containing protein n=1 Tax=Stieleria sedimenti TaxID=2976331 RepID=UPI00218011E2|nr:helix-turn-helix domain-containing protein [Stieleria sedimenti]MCS7466286.1 helix-turn-helix domain-containing protein [Stieleria sedimenti]